MRTLHLATIAALVALAACSGGKGSAGPSPTPTDPIAFPLFDGAEVLASHDFHETITEQGARTDLMGQGAGTYAGHEVVAGTQALMPALETWLQSLTEHPPVGYAVAAAGSGVEAVRARTQAMGLDFAAFDRIEDGKHHGVLVLAVDPPVLDAKAGPVLGMIGKFHLLPKTLRDPIDAQAKKQTGFTVTEMTQPDTPVGAAVAALDQLRDYGGRGVVLIDAVQQ